MASILLLSLFIPILTALAISCFNRRLIRFAGFVSALSTFISFAALIGIYGKIGTGETVLVSAVWVPSLQINLSFLIDGLSFFFGFLVTGVGTLVNLYAQFYMENEDVYLKRFYVLLNLFTAFMLGCVFSDNLMLMFLFWELTGVASFLLVGYSFTDLASILSARMVYLITSLTGLFFLVGILMIGNLYQTFQWTKIATEGSFIGAYPMQELAIILCFMIAVFGKSAQFPLHFWLPNAMCAPTPVSAYLHSATMVKLGVFLTARMYPIFVTSEIWFPLVVSVCLTTMLVGAVLSLLSNDLKMILAYATVSQLGFFISIYGMGDETGVSYDIVHILNHALYKGSLFMLVGILYHATGIRDIRRLGGLWKHLPATMVVFFVASLAMAGIPGTIGFVGKELLLKDLLLISKDFNAGVAILAVIVLASVFKVAFSIRLFYHIFVRELPGRELKVHKPNWQVLIAPAILSLGALFFGIWPKGLDHLVDSFYVSGLHSDALPELKVWHGWSFELMISMVILAAGTLLFKIAEKWNIWSLKHPFPDFGLLWNRLLDDAVRGAKRITQFLQGNGVQRHLAVIFLAFSISIGAVLVFGQNDLIERLFGNPGSIYRMTALVMIAGTTLAVPFLKDGFSQVLALASSGFFVTLYFVFFKAPDLAMTQILVEVVTGMMLLVMVWVFRNEDRLKEKRGRIWIRATIAFLTAAASALVALSYADRGGVKPLADYFLASALPLAHGTNAVNVILVDFRGLDTLGEITVLLIAAIGILGLVSSSPIPRIAFENRIRLISSDILKTLTPALFFVINGFALYLLVRGHNEVGGGFIAGLASGIAFVLLGFSIQLAKLKKMIPVNLLLFSGSGVVLAFLVGLFPTLMGKAFLTHGLLEMPTALLFDIGVFVVVLGIVLISIFALRADALKEDHHGQ